MMSLPSDTSPLSTSHALAQRRYSQALELEKQLRILLQAKGPFDSNVRSLRNNIRENFEAVILDNHEFAESHDVEQAIWRLHYKQIDEFRAKIKKNNAMAVAAPNIPAPGSKVVPRKEPIHKVLAIFKSFLAEATGFYHNLILKLRAKHGLPQDYSAFEGIETGVSADDEVRAAEVKRCQLSCHRCLIFLGDLARYKELHGDGQDVRSYDWSVAAGYYLQAASLWPSSGNPHNQLAVLATYVGDELLAVYRYFRSLAVETPFLTARDNLILLFEKNRQHYSQLHSGSETVSSKSDVPTVSEDGKAGKVGGMLSVGDGAVQLAVKERKQETGDLTANGSSAELRKSFRVCFVRLNGILFTRTSLETFPEVYSATVGELERLLAREDASLEAGLGADHRSGVGMHSAGASGVLQLVAILIFTIHNVNWGLETHHPTYAEILQRLALFQHAFIAAFECVGRLMRRCTESKDATKSPLLPAVLVFLEWLACQPKMAVGSEINEKQASARSFFWRQCLNLLNTFSECSKGQGDVNGGLEGRLTLGSLDAFSEDESEGGVALWEDYQLRGFVPLVPAQTALDYSKRPPREGMGHKKERQLRVQRLVAAGKAVATSLEGTGRGICYDDELEKFVMAGEVREKEKEQGVGLEVDELNDLAGEEEGNESEDASDALLNTSSSDGGGWNLEPPLEMHLSPPAQGLTTRVAQGEEEDEEVIVFRPMSKDGQANNSSPAEESGVGDRRGPVSSVSASSAVASEIFAQPAPVVKNSYGNHWVPEAPRGGAPVSSSNIQGLHHSGQQPAYKSASYLVDSLLSGPTRSGVIELAVPAPWITSSVSGSIAATAPSLAGVAASLSTVESSGLSTTVKGVSTGSFGLPYSPMTSNAGDWLNCMPGASAPAYSPATAFGGWEQVSVFANGPDKMSTAAGVIGQPRQTTVSTSPWSSQLEALATNGLSSARLGTLTSNGGLMGETKPLSTPLPHSSTSEISAIPAPVKYASMSNGVVAPVPSTVWSSKNNPTPNRVGPPTMRPPPGFGPLPAKPALSAAMGTPQGITRPPAPNRASQLPSEADEHQADDYGWLDGYKSAKPTVTQAGYQGQGGSSLYSSSYGNGMWSLGSNNLASSGSDATSFPFPGMGGSHHCTTTSSPLPPPPPPPQLQPSYSEVQQKYDIQWQRQLYEAQAQAQAQLHHRQQQHLLISQRQQQQQQQQPQQWSGQFRSQDPFVS